MKAGGALQNPAYRLADILRRSVFWRSEVPLRVKKAHLAKNEGFGPTRRTPLQFIPCCIGFLEFGTYIGTYNPFRPVRLP